MLYYRFAAEGDVAAAQANLEAYKQALPFPAWAIAGVFNRLIHRLHSVSRFLQKTTGRALNPGSRVKRYRN